MSTPTCPPTPAAVVVTNGPRLRLPTLAGTIERRILANYRVDPEVVTGLLPQPFRPQLVNGYAMACICLIRLAGVRPKGMCRALGIRSENAAHRFAVEWEESGQVRSGVYIPRRDTDNRLNCWAGGRIFPGVHQYASFRVDEHGDRIAVELESIDGRTRVTVDGCVAADLPRDSVFSSLSDASLFFERGVIGYSDARDSRYDGLRLHCPLWKVEPLRVDRIASSFFDDKDMFPAGTVRFDHALLMRDVPHEWLSCDSLRCLPTTS